MIIHFPLPKGRKILVKENDEVEFETSLFKLNETKDIKIPISQLLDINPKDIFLSLTKNIGDKITAGEIVAKKKGLLSEKKYISDYTGVIKEIDHDEGSILLTVQDKTGENINSYFKGRVKKIEDENIDIDVKELEKIEVLEASDFFGGEVLVIEEKDLPKLKENISSKILLIKNIQDYNQLKLEVIGAAGYITTSSLNKQLDIPYARIDSDNWDKIKKIKLPYCTIIKGEKVAYFYR